MDNDAITMPMNDALAVDYSYVSTFGDGDIPDTGRQTVGEGVVSSQDLG